MVISKIVTSKNFSLPEKVSQKWITSKICQTCSNFVQSLEKLGSSKNESLRKLSFRKICHFRKRSLQKWSSSKIVTSKNESLRKWVTTKIVYLKNVSLRKCVLSTMSLFWKQLPKRFPKCLLAEAMDFEVTHFRMWSVEVTLFSKLLILYIVSS